MRSRRVVVLSGVLAVVLLAGCGSAYVLSRRMQGSPERAARDYFAAWSEGAFDRMARLAADPPADFAAQHRALSRGLSVTSVGFEPGPVVRDAADPEHTAHVGFTVTRQLTGIGAWTFRAVLRLGVVGGRWKVLWSPATLHPDVREPGTWKQVQVPAPTATFVARDGRALPADGMLRPYVAELTERFGGVDEDSDVWAVEFQGGGPAQRLKVFGGHADKKIRTTLDLRLQAAAESAVAGSAPRGAIVAVRASTGEVLAVADTAGSRDAFLGHYPPGSSFKVVTAAGLLADGMSPGSGVDCPGTVVTAQRTIRNHDGSGLGRTVLRDAFAQSCNTTFARLAVERLGAAELTTAAAGFGFGGPITPGVGAARGVFPEPVSGAEVAEAAFGQGRVEASPLMMALVAAAVADGTWRPPRMVDARLIRSVGDPVQRTRRVPDSAALRSMMRAVVTDGTAARAGLPAGVAGKTGTAENPQGPPHAWFIGFRGDLAFAVLVLGGGSGAETAAPLAARFLSGR